MPKSPWFNKKPDTVADWLGIVFASIAFFLLLSNIGVFLGGFGKLLGFLSPFAGGVVIAYILNPVVEYCHARLLKGKPRMRWLAILIAYALAVLALSALVWLVAPQVAASFTQLFNAIPEYIKGVQQILADYGEEDGLAALINEFLQDYSQLMSSTYEMVTAMAPTVMGYLGNITSNFLAVLTALASSVYMLADKDHLLRQLRTLAHAFLPPRVAHNVLRICGHANANFSGFFVGKIVDSLIIGVLTFVCMLVLRLEFAPLISVVVGITNIIPVFGPFIGAVPSVIILLFVDPLQALVFLVLILIIQQLDGNVIGPKILGQSIGISALWVLFAIVLGGDLLGLVGMVLGVPVFATLYGLARELVDWCLMRRGIDAEGKPLPDIPENIDEWTIRN